MNEIVELGLKRPDAAESEPPHKPAPAAATAPGPAAATPPAAPGAAPPPPPSPSAAPGAKSEHNLAVFIDRVLATLSTLAPGGESVDLEEFRGKLDEYRQVVLDPNRRIEVPRVTEACVLACQKYLRGSREYHGEREKELTEVISILREAAKLTVGDSTEFNTRLMATSERFSGLVHVDDIRELKRKLTTEVQSFREAVEDKQRKDEQAYAQLTQKVETLQSRLTQVEEEASTDPLTRINNRGAFQRTLTRWVKNARDTGTPLSLAMFDVDNFKQINDTHGHPIGDRVLLCTAQALSKGLRQTDFVARYGGEEFVVLLSGAGVGQVEERLVQLVQAIAQSQYDYELLGKKETVRFTVSCGLTDLQPNDGEDDLVKRADEALYDAKHKGKNRVVSTKKKSLFGSLMNWA